MSYKKGIVGSPANVIWNIVRGDDASLKVDFFEANEVDRFDISDWEFESSAYDRLGDVVDELEVVVEDGYVIIQAAADITENWGTGSKPVVAELPFDLQVVIDNQTITVILGTIVVAGDVTGADL